MKQENGGGGRGGKGGRGTGGGGGRGDIFRAVKMGRSQQKHHHDRSENNAAVV